MAEVLGRLGLAEGFQAVLLTQDFFAYESYLFCLLIFTAAHASYFQIWVKCQKTVQLGCLYTA